MPIVIPKRCTLAQRRYLKERVETIHGPHRYGRAHKTPKDPEGIRIAREQIRAWEKQVSKAQDKIDEKYHAMKDAVDKAIHFGDPDAALAAVEAFEKEYRIT